MTTKAVEVQANGVMTLVTETPSARVATLTAVEANFIPVAVTNEFFSNFLQEVHVMKPHIFGFSNTFLVLCVRSLQER